MEIISKNYFMDTIAILKVKENNSIILADINYFIIFMDFKMAIIN
jgi:hypothetical protein